VGLYLLVFTSLGAQIRTELSAVKYGISLFFLLGSLFVGVTGQSSFSLERLRAGFANREWILPLYALFGYGVWCVFASFFALSPSVALTGSTLDLSDSALMNGVFVLIAARVYAQGRANPRMIALVLEVVVWTCSVLAVVSLLELLRSKGFVYPFNRVDLPSYNFPKNGHFAGLFALAIGVGLTLPQKQKLLVYIPLSLCAFTIGLTSNRAALVAVGIVALLVWIFRDRTVGLKALVILVCFGAGLGLRTTTAPDTRAFSSSGSLFNRAYLWKSAARATLDRPVTGWGGSGLVDTWADYLFPSEVKTVIKSEYGVTVTKRVGPIFFIKDEKGSKSFQTFDSFKSHDQYLETALLYGFPALLFYLWILYLAFRQGRWKTPAGLGLLAYGLFLFFWFLIPEIEGIYWVLVGLALASSSVLPSSAIKTRSETAPVPSS